MSWSSRLHSLQCISLTSGMSFGTHENHHAAVQAVTCFRSFLKNFLDWSLRITVEQLMNKQYFLMTETFVKSLPLENKRRHIIRNFRLSGFSKCTLLNVICIF